MTIGDIGSIIETFEYDTDRGTQATTLKLAEGVIAIWHPSTLAHMILQTYPVDAAGNIGTLIDSWDFHPTTSSGSYLRPCVVPVAGNIFAVCYRGFVSGIGTYLHIQTMTIGTDGTITKTAIDSEYFNTLPDPTRFSGFIKKPGTTIYVAFWDESGVAPDGYLATFSIGADGTNVTLVDSWEFDTTEGQAPVIIHISGHIFAITYNDGTNRILKTFAVADDGTITKSWIDTETFGDDTNYSHQIEQVSGSVYAVFVTATTTVYTFNIASDGAITAISSGVFSTVTLLEVRAYNFNNKGSDYYFLCTGRNGWDGRLTTVPISDAGVIGSIIEESVLFPNYCQYFYNIVIPVSGIFLITWSDTPGADGFISTVDVVVASGVYPSDTIARVSSIRHICQPGFYRMQVGLGDLGFDIDVAEATVRKALDTAKEAEPPPPRREVMPGRLPPRAEIIEPEVRPPAEPPPEKTAVEKLLEARVKPPDYFPVSEKVTAPQPVFPKIGTEPSLWERITPWKEEAGETYGKKVAERLRAIGKFFGGLFK